MAKKKTSKANETPPDDTLADKATEGENESEADQKDESEQTVPPKDDAGDALASDAATTDDAAKTDAADDEASKDLAGAGAVTDTPDTSDRNDDGKSGASGTIAVEAHSDMAATTRDVTGDATSDPSQPIGSEAPTPERVEQVVVRKGGFLPMVLGGIAAGAVGFGAAYFGFTESPDADAGLGPQLDELSATVESQAQTVDGLSARLDELPPAADLSPIEGEIADISTQATDLGAVIDEVEVALSALSIQLNEIDARLTQVEQQPITQDASEAAVNAYERALASAQDQLAEQRDELREQVAQQQEAMQAQRAELEALIEEAMSSENEAEQAALEAMRRSAISRTVAAIESGAPFQNALSDLESAGMESPEALAAVAEEGAPSAVALQDSFPDVARQALSASRSAAAESGDAGGFSSFLRSQLGARSLEPREGNDPDAVLSRAEAAVRDGRLNDALAEIEALPEPGQAVLSDWVAQANRRLEAMNAAQDLSEKLN